MDEEDNIFAVILAAYVFESSDNDDQDDQLPQKRRRVWKKNWIEHREQEGFCVKLYRELRQEEPRLHYNFLRMTPDQFDCLRHHRYSSRIKSMSSTERHRHSFVLVYENGHQVTDSTVLVSALGADDFQLAASQTDVDSEHHSSLEPCSD